MGRKITVNYEEKPCYDIELQQDFGKLPEKLKELGFENRKICIVTDSNVGKLYLKEITQLLEPISAKCVSYVFDAGEASKNTDIVGKVYEHLILNSFDRKDLLVALGGGVVGDLTGFTAATYLRGIDFLQVPTTLLAQVDSSIGGKTGVDFMQYKNMVGAFYMPKLVYMNLSALKTLPKRQISSGMGEIIKHGLIKDTAYFSYLEENSDRIKALDMAALEELVYGSCEIKRNVVENDPKEQGERALLNFGHTLGHAIEKLSGFSMYHGECVAVGMAGAGYISMKLGYITKEQLEMIEATIQSYGLPVRIPEFSHTPEEILAATKLDKKMESGKVKFIVLKEIGNAVITKELTDEELLSGISYVTGA